MKIEGDAVRAVVRWCAIGVGAFIVLSLAAVAWP